MFCKENTEIKNWKQFSRKIRRKKDDLLTGLKNYSNSILIIGCQRSGTTLLSRIITNSEGMVKYCFSKDDELDAALILSEHLIHEPRGRYCFQVTYLNSHYTNLFPYLETQKTIWVLRNPYSVIYSMIYNWNSDALDTLFQDCGLKYIIDNNIEIDELYKSSFLGISKIYKAIFSYNARILQSIDIKKRAPKNYFFATNYENIIENTHDNLIEIYNFIGLKYEFKYGNIVEHKSMRKAKKMKKKQKELICKYCMPVYEQVKDKLF